MYRFSVTGSLARVAFTGRVTAHFGESMVQKEDNLMRQTIKMIVFLFALLLFLSNAELRAQEQPFYQGKTIRIIVGFTTGGFYDLWSRLLARYVPKYIHGNPEILVQNMPAAGGLVAANHVYNVAKPDGLTLG